MSDLKTVYDQRYYLGRYREHLSGYEIARWEAIDHFITTVLNLNPAQTVLGYGAGRGLHVELWEKVFPKAELHFCDISLVAMEKLRLTYPRYADRCHIVHEHRADLDNGLFDVIVSIEVMEHVEQLKAYLQDVQRLLKPGGRFVWTTPCANRLSIEHVYNLLTRQIEPTWEGHRRWRWEDPTHLRRLRSREIQELLKEHGFSHVRFRFRAHFFSFVCTYFPGRGLMRLREKLMTVDYRLFRFLPNGASMLGSAKKLG